MHTIVTPGTGSEKSNIFINDMSESKETKKSFLQNFSLTILHFTICHIEVVPPGFMNSFTFQSSVMPVEGPDPFANDCSHQVHLSFNSDSSCISCPQADCT